ncbi:hypothetical protein ACFWM1_19520 [Nocardia sp. NPDC058379]|uniref:hypothetical protein n=1 Tax=unclassified Nocardia TaxID=2637762 RepID=UPI00364FBFD4
MVTPVSRYDELSRDQLAALVPELLLTGHLIDRSGMAHTIAAFGRAGMTEVAIEEWQLASPVYTRRMRRALGITGDGVETIFKGLQLDIGAPPQFMDFRFRVDDHDHGEFWLDHCGALADVEPMGEEFVVAMCHDIEDPTFDATALATNPHAQVRPIHRPPRVPADRTPVCAWTVVIDPSHVPPAVPRHAAIVANSAAARLELAPIDPAEEGMSDYAGPLLSDLRFTDFSPSALRRLADEICVQQHLLTLGFLIAIRERTDPATAVEIGRKQLAGIAGLTSERIGRCLAPGDDPDALATVMRVHPALNPLSYTGIDITVSGSGVRVRFPSASPAMADGAWPALLTPADLRPLDALIRGVNPRFVARVGAVDEHGWTAEIELAEQPFREASEVAVTRFSTGAGFAFADRGKPLPLTVV